MTTVFVPDYEWNAQYSSVEAAVEAGLPYGDYTEGTEFTMIRLTVGAKTTYKMIDGKPVPIVVAFPEGLPQ